MIKASNEHSRAGEVAKNLIDGKTATKWLDPVGVDTRIDITLAEPTLVTSYAFYSANDTSYFPSRAMKSWCVEGTTPNGSVVPLEKVDLAQPDTLNFHATYYDLPSPGVYSKISFVRINEGQGNPLTQLSRIVVYGVPSNTPSAAFYDGIEVGDEVDCVDTVNIMYRSSVLDRNLNSVFVHYQGWPADWDEWVYLSSGRVRPCGPNPKYGSFGPEPPFKHPKSAPAPAPAAKPAAPKSVASKPAAPEPSNKDQPTAEAPAPKKMSLKEMKRVLKERAIDYSKAIEAEDLVELIRAIEKKRVSA